MRDDADDVLTKSVGVRVFSELATVEALDAFMKAAGAAIEQSTICNNAAAGDYGPLEYLEVVASAVTIGKVLHAFLKHAAKKTYTLKFGPKEAQVDATGYSADELAKLLPKVQTFELMPDEPVPESPVKEPGAI